MADIGISRHDMPAAYDLAAGCCLRRTTPEVDGCGWITAPRISRQGRGGCRDYLEEEEDKNA